MWPALVFASSVIMWSVTVSFTMVPVVTTIVLVFHSVTVTCSFPGIAARSAPWSPPFVAVLTRLALSVSLRPELRGWWSSATFVLPWRWAVAALRTVRSWVAPPTEDKRTSGQQQKKLIYFKHQPGVQVWNITWSESVCCNLLSVWRTRSWARPAVVLAILKHFAVVLFHAAIQER